MILANDENSELNTHAKVYLGVLVVALIVEFVVPVIGKIVIWVAVTLKYSDLFQKAVESIKRKKDIR